MRNKKWEQYRTQAGKCPVCSEALDLNDCRFAKAEFREGEENVLVCHRCQKKVRGVEVVT